MRIAAYLRVSTDQQSHDSQRAELEDYCRRRGWTDLRWFTDTASEAKNRESHPPNPGNPTSQYSVPRAGIHRGDATAG